MVTSTGLAVAMTTTPAPNILLILMTTPCDLHLGAMLGDQVYDGDHLTCIKRGSDRDQETHVWIALPLGFLVALALTLALTLTRPLLLALAATLLLPCPVHVLLHIETGFRKDGALFGRRIDRVGHLFDGG